MAEAHQTLRIWRGDDGRDVRGPWEPCPTCAAETPAGPPADTEPSEARSSGSVDAGALYGRPPSDGSGAAEPVCASAEAGVSAATEPPEPRSAATDALSAPDSPAARLRVAADKVAHLAAQRRQSGGTSNPASMPAWDVAMGPHVAAPLAAWLRAEAAVTDVQAADFVDPAEPQAAAWLTSLHRHALAFADLILGKVTR